MKIYKKQNYKPNQTNHNHYKKLLISIALLTPIIALPLAASYNQEDKPTSEYQGRNDAQMVKPQIHDEYLACYPLNESAKQQCTDELTSKYIQKKWQQDKEYIQSFQFQSEKLGFKRFINNLSLPCEEVSESPIFTEDKQAYSLICKPKGQYLMQFNYDNKEWKLINELTITSQKP